MDAKQIKMLREGHFDELILSLRQELNENPNDSQVLFDLAITYQQGGHFYRALDIYQDLTRRNPNDPMMLVNYGQLLYSAREYGKAIELFTRVIEIARNKSVPPQVLSMAHTNLGAVHGAMYDFDEAVYQYETAILIDPNNQLAVKYLNNLKELSRQDILRKKLLTDDNTPSQFLSGLSEATKYTLSNLWVINGATLKKWRRFRVFEEIRYQLIQLPIENGALAYFISHRWETAATPDPDNYQYRTLWAAIKDDAYYWYDYSCMPQHPNSDDDHRYIKYILQNLNEIVRFSKVIILRRASDDYFARGWCFHEWYTAQYTGLFDRTFLGIESQANEIIWAKRQSDRLLCGDYSFLDSLKFSEAEDRPIVTRLAKSVAVECQKKVAQTCLDVITNTISDAKYDFPTGLAVTSDDIYQRFPRLVRFIKTWTQVLQPVEPVTNRIAMFMHRNHWEALIDISRPIAVNLLSLEYSVELRAEESLRVERELRNVYEFCQRKMPETRYAVIAFLCFFLMGYDI
jgi:tetratricopeptide (TPR) repeat protein